MMTRRMTTRELFEQFFPGRCDVHRLLMEPITYANGSTLDEPAITYGIVFSNFMNKGVYTFQGGTDRLIGMMADELPRQGCRPSAPAPGWTASWWSKGPRAGVVVRGREITAKAVISNAASPTPLTTWSAEPSSPLIFLAVSTRSGSTTPAARSISACRKGESIPDIGDLLFTSTAEEFSSEEMLSMDTKSRTFSLYYPRTRPEPPDYTMVASMNADYRRLGRARQGCLPCRPRRR